MRSSAKAENHEFDAWIVSSFFFADLGAFAALREYTKFEKLQPWLDFELCNIEDSRKGAKARSSAKAENHEFDAWIVSSFFFAGLGAFAAWRERSPSNE
ncbi:MAG: hypothetical protein DWQ47_01480 [Acidobacteria bacterium]|nr:MAG: hypothetical protein DWQ32_11940 [Acidobacteriota bacterium]REK04168.1 MAG: hypothetical protein DWQ38_01465 [Acidobacteriota bacterium]REK15330.1 MAG: hypothetical protein DWQ43_17630 [Acidobacteriota bacterium]REK46420.1 MAG: hypothetical protein DWQ47_01480 [Acidobacteriota bacterium]